MSNTFTFRVQWTQTHALGSHLASNVMTVDATDVRAASKAIRDAIPSVVSVDLITPTYTITFGSRSQHAASTDDLAAARKIVEALRTAGHNPVMVNGQAPANVWGSYTGWTDNRATSGLIAPSNTFGQDGI
jgi:hypothetical protein